MIRQSLYALACTALSWTMSDATHAQMIEGQAEVIDGDSLRVAGAELRLFGIDAPEYTQSCYANAAPVTCGTMAKEVLEGMIAGSTVSCSPVGTDAYGRTVARCRTSGVDIAGALGRPAGQRRSAAIRMITSPSRCARGPIRPASGNGIS